MDESMSMSMPMMPMWFDNGDDLLLLFSDFKSEKGETGKYVGLLIFTAVLGLLIEAINYVRFRIQIKKKGTVTAGLDNNDAILRGAKLDSGSRIALVLTYFISVTLAYALMLCVMSFNAGCFIACIVGLTVGNFTFAPMRLQLELESQLAMKGGAAANKDIYQ